jgi:hypothetical protein
MKASAYPRIEGNPSQFGLLPFVFVMATNVLVGVPV